MTKSILVSGVAGFLGSHLAENLLEEGNVVIGVDNFITGKQENVDKLSKYKNFVFFEADVSKEHDIGKVNEYFFHEVYHLASPASPPAYQKAPFETIWANTIGTYNLGQIAFANNAKFLYTSTSEAYGDPEVHPQPEGYRGNVNTWGPRSNYDESKRLGESICYELHRVGVKVRVVRIFNTYSAGLRNDDGRVISNFVTQALTNQPITVYGTGEQTRSFCYVTDNIAALKLMMSTDAAEGEIINIGNPLEYKIIDVAHLVKKLVTGSTSEIIFQPLPKDDPKVRCPVIDKAKSILGWEPKVTLEEGLTMTIENYRKKLGLA